MQQEAALTYYSSTITTDMIDAASNAVLHQLAMVKPDLESHIVHKIVDSYHAVAVTPFALLQG